MRAVLTSALAVALLLPAAAAADPPKQGIVIPHVAPGTPLVELGRQLFAGNCATCHGADGRGIPNRGPQLRGVGALAPDFYLRNGYMPLERVGIEPTPSRPLFDDREIRAIVAYVEEAQHPQDRGGWALGHIGPVPEGLVAWLLATAALVAVCVLIGRRIES